MIGRMTLGLLRRHVGGGAEDHAGASGHDAERRRVREICRRGRTLDRSRQSKIEHLDLIVWRDLHIGRFEIAMHDPALVRGLERFRDLRGNAQRLVERQGAACDPLGERLPFYQLHDDEVTAVGFFHAEERGDVWMIERC